MATNNLVEDVGLPAPELIDTLVKMAESMKVLSTTRLTRKALVGLIHLESKLPKKTIEIVLNNLEQMDRIWLKPQK